MHVPIEILAARAEELNASSVRLGALTSSYLLADDLRERELAEMRLLAQATVEFEVARGLLAAVDTGVAKQAVGGLTGSDIQAGDQRALDELAMLLEDPFGESHAAPTAKDPFAGLPGTAPAPAPGGVTPPWAGGPSPFGTAPAGTADASRSGRSWQSFRGPQLPPPTDPAQAKLRLQTGVERALTDIINNAVGIGGEAVRGLLMLNMASLYEGLQFVSKDAAHLLDEAAGAIGGVARQLALAAGRLLLNAYDWVLNILGSGSQQQARRQALTWLNRLRFNPGATAPPLARLVMRLYTPDAIRTEVAELLGSNTIGMEPMVGAASAVDGLADRYRAKTAQVSRFLKVLAFVKTVPLLATPQGQALAAAVTLGLLSYILYTGYEHVDSGTLVFARRFGFEIPHRVDGIRATVRKALVEEEHPAPTTE